MRRAKCDLVHRARLDLQATADAMLGQPSDPVLYLARAVIAQACEEWRRGAYRYDKYRPNAEAVRAELREFFASPLFVTWCELADIDADYLRGRLEVSGCK